MRLFAFQGVRYTAKAGDAARLAAPPYDQIDDAARDRFQAASPYQFVHLTRPVATAAAAGGDPYRHAAELHRRWLGDGIVARDEQPSLYPYVVELSGGGPARRRLGVMALVGYAPASEIRPHEQTIDKPLADRRALLEATRADLEPALLLAEDGGMLDDLLAADLDGRAGRDGQDGRAGEDNHGGERRGQPGEPHLRPLVDYRDDAGHHHLLFCIADPARIAAYQEALAALPAAIADGHHRYKVGQNFAAEHPGSAGTAAGAKLAVVTSMSSRALTIDPIHRALRQPIDPALFADVKAAAVPFHGGSGAELARAVAAAPQPALGVWVAGRPPEIWRLLPAGAARAAGKPPPLAVKIFQDAVLPALGLSAEAATDGTLVYRSDADTLYAQLERGELGTGFWLPPMPPADFAAAVAQGELLPPKSTRFLPKAMSGLVWSDHQSRLT
jgi:uncharacterized protein (DUF1015 family)